MSENINFVGAAKLAEMIKQHQELLLLDIRSQEQYEGWHIPMSVNIPLEELDKKLIELPQDKSIVVICNRGNSSKRGAKLLEDAGLKALVLEGGLKQWNTVYDTSWIPLNAKSGLEVMQIKRIGKGCLSYLIFMKGSKKAVLIDPTHHVDLYKNLINGYNVELCAVCDTHVHADHVSGGRKLSEQLGAPYCLPEVSKVAFPFLPIEEKLSKCMRGETRIIATPGHTEESVCIVLNQSIVFTGDTLFIENVGRSDLGEEAADNARRLYESVTKNLFSLPGEVMIAPAHIHKSVLLGEPAYTADIAYVKSTNFISRFAESDAFTDFIESHSIPTPPNYQWIKDINRGNESADIDLDELELGSNRCAIG
ncbi:MBL fold metallo-hydrolase [Candidatus Jorgensenbacteria bacterium]|nr:MBL fold metallo-hydrolase [Candidatus Jorgensenbacteria bacterium]